MMHHSTQLLGGGDQEYCNEKRPVNVRVDATAHLAELFPRPWSCPSGRQLGSYSLGAPLRLGRITPEKSGGLKGSTQHWLAVYPPEFEIPTFFVAVDSDAERFRPGPTASSRTDPPSSAGTGAGAHWCFRSSRAAKGSADRRSRPVHR